MFQTVTLTSEVKKKLDQLTDDQLHKIVNVIKRDSNYIFYYTCINKKTTKNLLNKHTKTFHTKKQKYK